MKLPDNVKIGPGHNIGEHVILGVRPASAPEDSVLTIGKNATIRSHSVLYVNTRIGDNLQTGHKILIREETTIGDDCLIGSHSIIEKGCRIGNRVTIQSAVYIPNLSIIEDDVFIGPRVCLTNDKYMIMGPDTPLEGPIIQKKARIGANSTLLPGVTIGENTVIGAASVVTRDIPANKVAFGNPARIIKDIDE